MPNATNITYGSYNFQRDGGPVPFLTINKDFIRTDGGQRIGTKVRITLQGELNLLPSGVSGYKNVDTMQDLLCSGFMEDCQEFTVSCDGDILIQQYPRVNSITFSPTNDNWSQTSDFTIELEYDGESYSGLYLENISENWDLSIDTQASLYNFNDIGGGTGDNNMHLFALSHTLSAKGSPTCSGSRPAWQEARDWVISRLGYSSGDYTGSGVFNLNAITYSGWNHSRVQRIGETDGTFEVTESWLIADSGFLSNCGAAIEDFTATLSFNSQDGLTTIGLQGSIQGLENVDYGLINPNYTIIQNKYDNASGFWDCVRPKLAGRASLFGNGTNVNPIPLNFSIGHNPPRGIITYNYTFDNRPCTFVTGALFENITITDTYPTDVFAEVAVLGRGYGPVLQDLSTVTSSKRSVSIEVVMPPLTSCVDIIASINNKPNVSGLLCALQQDLSGVNTQLFKSQDQESWDFKTYRRNVEWTWVNCGGPAPNTSFCV